MTEKVKVKKGKAKRKEQFWPMKMGGPYSKTEGDATEIYKCTECGAETESEKGWNGTPNAHRCSKYCTCNSSDWRNGVSPVYRRNFDRIFPDAPGAGL